MINDLPVADGEVLLKDLLSIHRSESHYLGLDDVLGDGALICRFSALERLRAALLSHGYTFANASEIKGIHALFPILELDEILASKVIPYFRTAKALEYVIERHPQFSMSYGLFHETCNASHAYHESCHAIFHQVFHSTGMPVKGRELVESMLVGEAFAMAFEQFIALRGLADGRLSTSLFLAANAYANPFMLAALEVQSGMSELNETATLAEMLPHQTIKMLTVAHLCALLRPNLFKSSPALAQRLADIVDLRDAHAEHAETLLQIGLRVSSDFRINVLRQYFSFTDLNSALELLRSEPLEALVESERVFGRVLPSVIDRVL